jgi:hypothetical protein
LPRHVGITAAATPILAVLTFALAGAAPARADIVAAAASDLIQSTAVDVDFMMLTQFVGYQPGQTLSYNSSATTNGWAGTLSGDYAGTALSLSYIGNLSAYPPDVTWSNTGTYGAAAWSDTGSATITYPTATTFQVALTESLMEGSNTASLSYTIPGTVLGSGAIVFGSAAGDEAGTGSGVINGAALAGICFSYANAGTAINANAVIGTACGGQAVVNTSVIGAGNAVSGTISTTPEPSYVIVFGFGISALLLLRKRTAATGREAYRT